MNLRILTPPHWSVARSLLRWSRRLKVQLAGPYQPVREVILIGNGVPDNIVAMLLAHKLNGRRAVGLAKPPGALSAALRELIFQSLIRKVLLLFDQEDRSLNDAWRSLESELRRAKMEYRILSDEERLRVYGCRHGSRQLRVIAVVNGLEAPYRKHTIEDHLLKICEKLRIYEAPLPHSAESPDPKELWSRLKEHHERVYRYILQASMEELKDAFHHHLKGAQASAGGCQQLQINGSAQSPATKSRGAFRVRLTDYSSHTRDSSTPSAA